MSSPFRLIKMLVPWEDHLAAAVHPGSLATRQPVRATGVTRPGERMLHQLFRRTEQRGNLFRKDQEAGLSGGGNGTRGRDRSANGNGLQQMDRIDIMRNSPCFDCCTLCRYKPNSCNRVYEPFVELVNRALKIFHKVSRFCMHVAKMCHRMYMSHHGFS
jgi:hypothetical protein